MHSNTRISGTRQSTERLLYFARRIVLIIAFAVTLLFAAPTFADDFRDKINEGYDFYKSGVYDKANDKFSEAGVLKPEQAIPDYYKGAARYKLNDFQGAINEFESSAAKNDPKLRADSYFNTGNAYMKTRQYDKAVESYVNALKIDPEDEDYKHNLEMALLQMQQQQQQNQQSQDQGQDGNQNQQQQEQKPNEQQQQQAQNEGDKKDQQQQQSQLQKQQMNKKQAEELLARYEDDEKETQKRLKQVMMKGRSINDW